MNSALLLIVVSIYLHKFRKARKWVIIYRITVLWTIGICISIRLINIQSSSEIILSFRDWATGICHYSNFFCIWLRYMIRIKHFELRCDCLIISLVCFNIIIDLRCYLHHISKCIRYLSLVPIPSSETSYF